MKRARILLLTFLVLLACCRKENVQPPPLDHPLLSSSVTMGDVTFYSASLQRNMPYRVVLPQKISERTLPAVYLLHGGGGGFRDWTNYSDVAQFAESGLVLVMPEGQSSYYTNSATNDKDRYEDYIVRDLIADVESKFPVQSDREHRAIVGVSMGGFGAVKIGLDHPDLFTFIGGLSSAIDVPRRPFSIKRVSQYAHHRSIFGPWGSNARKERDPFFALSKADAKRAPFFYLTCGEQEGLLPANRQFSAQLRQHNFEHVFIDGPGGHDWNQWNRRLPDLFQTLRSKLPSAAPTK
jgi:S-formylglutathione hydrolase FrmB